MKKKLTKVDFKNKDIFLGVDVHTNSWNTSILCDDVLLQKNFVSEPEKFAEYFKTHYPGAKLKVAYEAGCFGFWIKEKLESLGIDTIVINPADIPTTDKEKRQKTDKSDSRKIAITLRSSLLQGIYVPEKEQQEERALVRRRLDLTKKMTRIKNQIKADLKFYGIKYPEEYDNSKKHWSANFVKWLHSINFTTNEGKARMESYLRELEFYRSEKLVVMRQIRGLSRSEQYKEIVDIIISTPGIGSLGAMVFKTEIVDIRRFRNNNEMCSYLGLSPNENSSGEKRQVGHMTKRCNHRLRRILIEAAWIAVRNDPALTLYFAETSKKIGNKKAIVKVAKKLSKRIRHNWLNNCKYEIGIAA